MTSSGIQCSDHVCEITGAVDFDTAPVIFDSSASLFADHAHQTLIINFAHLNATLTNSALLALIVEWLRLAKAHGVTLKFQAFPERFLSITKLSGLYALMESAIT